MTEQDGGLLIQPREGPIEPRQRRIFEQCVNQVLISPCPVLGSKQNRDRGVAKQEFKWLALLEVLFQLHQRESRIHRQKSPLRVRSLDSGIVAAGVPETVTQHPQ